MNVQDYLRGVQTKDLKRYLQAADEVALVDGYDKSEVDALQRIKNYISPPEAVEFPATTCQSCGGRMSVDEYGYKAVCNYCGIEIILNSNNKPVLAYQDGVKATNKSSGTDMVQDKRKKGKIALKVALGVMTGGVSLIPDAVSAVKKNN